MSYSSNGAPKRQIQLDMYSAPTPFYKKPLFLIILLALALTLGFLIRGTKADAFEYTGSMLKDDGITWTDYFIVHYISPDVYGAIFYNSACYGSDPVENLTHQFSPKCSTMIWGQYVWYGMTCTTADLEPTNCVSHGSYPVGSGYINSVFVDSGGGNYVLNTTNADDWATSKDIYSSGGDHDIILSVIPPESTMTITTPASGSTQSEAFTLEGTYDQKGEDWDFISIRFLQNDAQSVCPAWGSATWEEERLKGWQHFETEWVSSDDLTGDTGGFILGWFDMRAGNYNCTYCHFVNWNEDYTNTFSNNKCPDFTLIVGEGGISFPSPDVKIPYLSWLTYYSGKSPYASSTALFTTIAGAFSPVVDKLGGFILYMKGIFNSEEAVAKGTELGSAIPIARGYLTEIDDFFGGLPVSTFFIFYLLVLAIVISYKLILQIVKLFKP